MRYTHADMLGTWGVRRVRYKNADKHRCFFHLSFFITMTIDEQLHYN